jgi:hypothetical protein
METTMSNGSMDDDAIDCEGSLILYQNFGISTIHTSTAYLFSELFLPHSQMVTLPSFNSNHVSLEFERNKHPPKRKTNRTRNDFAKRRAHKFWFGVMRKENNFAASNCRRRDDPGLTTKNLVQCATVCPSVHLSLPVSPNNWGRRR